MTPSRRGGLLDALDDSTLTQVIANFYDRMLADERLAHYFADINMAKLRAHQRSFLLAALSGPELFNGLTLATSHLPLGLTHEDFDRSIAHLTSAMAESGVPEVVVASIPGRLEPLRAHLVVGVARSRTA